MYYAVQHKTYFRYSASVSESVTEVHLRPRSEDTQRCLRFNLITFPHARVSETADFLRNSVHFFDIPSFHQSMTILAEATVEMLPMAPLPEALTDSVWADIDLLGDNADFWDMLTPSPHIPDGTLLRAFMRELNVYRHADPLTLLRALNTQVYYAFDYVPNVTAVDSAIDDILTNRKGVCQDFAHIMIGVTRMLGLPSRYVSGYLYHLRSDTERSTPDATHAWMEVYLPTLGWVGFDPTNNVLAGDRHIRVAVGRDYSDVPPTRGVFKGKAESELEVEVHITPAERPFELEALVPMTGWTPEEERAMQAEAQLQQQQQQQQ
ncbi:MAG: transglutaminase family protein [Chloroflexi bacterium]|uniref:transglutaminase family protein n=1 Tax=Candidatus Flexifilum breve TaxID=3140694 RepID=UPI00313573A1|nr:transglutaminase family protein [Chloroflexota bacterium]